jgi:ABC-type Fe3+-hydroxamate transport system substrate-binding protein
VLGIAAGCGDDARRPPAAAVRDDAGRPVALAAPAARIVSLAPSVTELLFAIGAGPQVVGRTRWCRYPAAALAVPDVGDGLNPNLEAVAARRPDLVVLYHSPLNETAAAQLERLGIATAVLRQDRLADVARHARLLGRLTGRVGAGDSIARIMDSLAAARPPAPGARVAFVVWDNPPTVIGAGSYLDQLGRLAGAANVFGDVRGASAAVSLETIAARDPDAVIVLADSPAAARPAWARRPEWQVVPAVRAGRFIVLPGDLFGRPSPRAPEAVTDLRRRLAHGAGRP